MKDIKGQKYGRLLVMEYSHTNSDKKAVWKCVCDCGNICYVSGKHMRSGNTSSCGCYAKEVRSSSTLKHGGCSGGKSKEYFIWRSMISRCYRLNDKSYAHYGGRGIKVCRRWRYDFSVFMKDMGDRPEGYTIERLNVNKGYTPENCRWATFKDQANNKKNNKVLTYNGHSMTVSRWADKLKCKPSTLYQRIYRKWSTEKILTYGF